MRNRERQIVIGMGVRRISIAVSIRGYDFDSEFLESLVPLFNLS